MQMTTIGPETLWPHANMEDLESTYTQMAAIKSALALYARQTTLAICSICSYPSAQINAN